MPERADIYGDRAVPALRAHVLPLQRRLCSNARWPLALRVGLSVHCDKRATAILSRAICCQARQDLALRAAEYPPLGLYVPRRSRRIRAFRADEIQPLIAPPAPCIPISAPPSIGSFVAAAPPPPRRRRPPTPTQQQPPPRQGPPRHTPSHTPLALLRKMHFFLGGLEPSESWCGTVALSLNTISTLFRKHSRKVLFSMNGHMTLAKPA